eukprot:GHVU01031562.1.p1 GENE.GHVU01031562.1~~GHVU01031562.1.p1  ORF type:complete len:106 (-),score=7.10 GHVU01031562.1:844-1161(-)
MWKAIFFIHSPVLGGRALEMWFPPPRERHVSGNDRLNGRPCYVYHIPKTSLENWLSKPKDMRKWIPFISDKTVSDCLSGLSSTVLDPILVHFQEDAGIDLLMKVS